MYTGPSTDDPPIPKDQRKRTYVFGSIGGEWLERNRTPASTRMIAHDEAPADDEQKDFGEMLDKFPDRLVEKAIKGMLPKNKIGRAMGSKLKVYRGDKHPHQAQQPVAVA